MKFDLGFMFSNVNCTLAKGEHSQCYSGTDMFGVEKKEGESFNRQLGPAQHGFVVASLERL